ncbi:MAG: beta-lactamase family protein [Silvanigrellaceae bacterium]|nr:beta-lactamase family protein [Silvanigrellaceae bacterium]
MNLKENKKKILVFYTFLLCAVFTTAETYSKQPYQPAVFLEKERTEKIKNLSAKIDKMFEEYAKKHHIPGYAFGIMVDGKLAYSGSGGYINVEKQMPATTKSMFRIASMTKSFTAMAILKLRDEGKLKLDNPIYLYIPELKKQHLTKDDPEITIRNLLNHSAGFPQDDPWADRQLAATESELLALIKKGLFFSNSPGSTYEYSNLAYTMLGYVIKKVTGISYKEYNAKNIWQPLNMKEATWEFTDVTPSQLAKGYRWLNSQLKEEELLHTGIFGAMGGIITSVESFSQYAAIHQNAWPPRDDVEKGPIKRSSIREMQQPMNFINLMPKFKYQDSLECPMVNASGYGLKWVSDCEKRVYVGHSGGLPGFGSNWFIMPDYGIGVISLANLTYAPAHEVNFNVLDFIIKEAQLEKMQWPVSQILEDRKNSLIKLLPNWEQALESNIFAENFFLDTSVATLQKETRDIFSKAGEIIRVNKMIPENQLRGYFIIEAKKANIRINFTLTPQNPPLIQKFEIKEEVK